VRSNESAQQAEALMQKHQLRRLPVVNDSGQLIGILSLNDLARASGQSPREVPSEEIMRTLAAISQPTRPMPGTRAQAT
jgi:CBS-domain-containing membrane protein